MIAVDALGYAILAGILLALGAFVGWLAGWLLSTLLGMKRRGLVDALSGMVGFFLGIYVSFLGFSVHEEWYDGKLLSRKVGGWADHFMLIGIMSSVGLVIVVKISPHIWSLVKKGQ